MSYIKTAYASESPVIWSVPEHVSVVWRE